MAQQVFQLRSLNLREGIGEFSHAEKARFCRMSARSLRETLGCLRVVLALQPGQTEAARAAARLGMERRPKIIRYATFHGEKAE